MGENDKKSGFVNLIIDEKTADMINGFLNICFEFNEDKIFEMYKELDCMQEASNFFKNWSDITHKMGWCKDPNCQRKDEETNDN